MEWRGGLKGESLLSWPGRGGVGSIRVLLGVYLRRVRRAMDSPTVNSRSVAHVLFGRLVPFMSRQDIKSTSESAASLPQGPYLPKALSQCGHRNGFSLVSTISQAPVHAHTRPLMPRQMSRPAKATVSLCVRAGAIRGVAVRTDKAPGRLERICVCGHGWRCSTEATCRGELSCF